MVLPVVVAVLLTRALDRGGEHAVHKAHKTGSGSSAAVLSRPWLSEEDSPSLGGDVSPSDGDVAEQHRSRGAVVVVGGHLVGVGGRVAVPAAAAAAAEAAAAAAAQGPGGRVDNGLQEAVTRALAHKAVERRVGQAVEGGEQQRQVVVVEDPWRSHTKIQGELYS